MRYVGPYCALFRLKIFSTVRAVGVGVQQLPYIAEVEGSLDLDAPIKTVYYALLV